MSQSPEPLKEQQEFYREKRDLLKTLGMDAPDFTDLLGEAFRDKQEEQELQLAFLTEAKRQQVTEGTVRAGPAGVGYRKRCRGVSGA